MFFFDGARVAGEFGRDFQQRFCAGCGYSLRGHGMRGRCPECGESYAPEMPVIFGWVGRPSRERARVAMGCSTAVGGLFGLTMLLGVLAGSYVVGIVFLVLMVAALSWLPVYRRSVRGRRLLPNAQVRLRPEGYGKRSGFGAVEVYRWGEGVGVSLVQEGRRWYRLRIFRRTSTGGTDLGTMIDLHFRASAARLAFLRDYLSACMGQTAAPAKQPRDSSNESASTPPGESDDPH